MFGLVKASRLRKGSERDAGQTMCDHAEQCGRKTFAAKSHAAITGRPLPKAGWWQFCCCGIGGSNRDG